MEENRKRFYRFLSAMAVILTALWLSACTVNPTGGNQPENLAHKMSGDILTVHFIDVGQGDSTLIGQNGHYMLIDAGERDKKDAVISYLKSQGVETLEYVIGTHPHSDHIGGLAEVIQEFKVDHVILPEKEHTTKTYERLLDAIEEKGLKITVPKAGDEFSVGEASFQIIGPNGDYGDELNNWSIGIRLAYGQNSFVLCGDAEKEAEEDMCNNGLLLQADVLKLSHHGSSTSSSDQFMDQVRPLYGVISCGKDNDYGHPHKEILEMLKKRNIKALRTDAEGTVVISSNGTELSFDGGFSASEPSEADPKAQAGKEPEQYAVNENTKKFHLPECTSVAAIKEENRKHYTVNRDELIDMGYEPCKLCNP